MSRAQTPNGWRVELETRNFTFAAYGATEEEANEAMGRALKRHGEQYGLPDDWADVYYDSFRTEAMIFGEAMRDWSPL